MNGQGWLGAAAWALNAVVLVWIAVQLVRLRRGGQGTERAAEADALQRAIAACVERTERELRDEVARSSSGTRSELQRALALFQQTLTEQQSGVARAHAEQLDGFRAQLAAQSHGVREAQDVALQRFGATLAQQLGTLSDANERRLLEVRNTVEQRLASLQTGNEAKLEQMRATVDEKLHATLEQRLGESFKQVAERLEHVHRGLGEMQVLAKDVGSLSRVLSNVKTRGIFGEVQLRSLLEQVFTSEQYTSDVETVPGSGARVEFALRLPGRREDGQPLWLPIDAKFPRDDYERLLDAHDRADAPAAEVAGKAIETRLKLEARSIRDKYVAPPHTTDFAILFVPTEGLYAEALRRPGLLEALQRDCRVMLTGPTTLLATLSSLQMGFRTLALEKRSVEVWEVLGAVKTEFAKFGDVLAKAKKKIDEASNTLETAQTRTRVMTRKLKSVEALAEPDAQALLPGDMDVADDVEAALRAALPVVHGRS